MKTMTRRMTVAAELPPLEGCWVFVVLEPFAALIGASKTRRVRLDVNGGRWMLSVRTRQNTAVSETVATRALVSALRAAVDAAQLRPANPQQPALPSPSCIPITRGNLSVVHGNLDDEARESERDRLATASVPESEQWLQFIVNEHIVSPIAAQPGNRLYFWPNSRTMCLQVDSERNGLEREIKGPTKTRQHIARELVLLAASGALRPCKGALPLLEKACGLVSSPSVAGVSLARIGGVLAEIEANTARLRIALEART